MSLMILCVFSFLCMDLRPAHSGPLVEGFFEVLKWPHLGEPLLDSDSDWESLKAHLFVAKTAPCLYLLSAAVLHNSTVDWWLCPLQLLSKANGCVLIYVFVCVCICTYVLKTSESLSVRINRFNSVTSFCGCQCVCVCACTCVSVCVCVLGMFQLFQSRGMLWLHWDQRRSLAPHTSAAMAIPCWCRVGFSELPAAAEKVEVNWWDESECNQ